MPYSLLFRLQALEWHILAKGITYKFYQSVRALVEIDPEVLWQKNALDLCTSNNIVICHFQS